MNKAVYLQTYGCQMNERDSEEVLGMLTAQGAMSAARGLSLAMCRDNIVSTA